MLFMEASNKGEFYSCSIILVWALYSDGKVQVLSDLNHIWLPPKILNGCKKAAIITRKDIASATNLTFNPIHMLYMMRSLLVTLADDRVLFLSQIWLRYDTQ